MLAGSVLGAYRVIQQIGAGGMGSVWVAEHTMLGRRAALKVLHPDMSERQDIVRRFFNEARAATTIPDPGIVQIFDFGYSDDGAAYIVMELLDGEVLERRVVRGPMEPTQALRLMRQAASTLGAAHARGIVHRDLKPDNIFIAKDPEVVGGERAKILDFGIAKLTDDRRTGAFRIDTHAGNSASGVLGTPLYMSPEQCRAETVDARSDVYALGCVLYQMLAGRYAFDADTPEALAYLHVDGPIPLPSQIVGGLPPGIDTIVERCLAKSPHERFANGSDLAAAITSITGPATDPAQPALRPSTPGVRTPTSNAIAEATTVAAGHPLKHTTLSRATGSTATVPRKRSPALLALSVVGAVALGVGASIVWRGARQADAIEEPRPVAAPETAGPTVTMPTVAPTPAPAPEAAAVTPAPVEAAPVEAPPVETPPVETPPGMAEKPAPVAKAAPVKKQVAAKPKTKVVVKTTTKKIVPTTTTAKKTTTTTGPKIELDENGVPIHR